jgi:hypothetical protein
MKYLFNFFGKVNACYNVHNFFVTMAIFNMSWWIFKKTIMMKVLELMMVYILIYHYVVKLVHIRTIQLLIGVHF